MANGHGRRGGESKNPITLNSGCSLSGATHLASHRRVALRSAIGQPWTCNRLIITPGFGALYTRHTSFLLFNLFRHMTYVPVYQEIIAVKLVLK